MGIVTLISSKSKTMPYYIDLPYHLSDGTTELTMTDGKIKFTIGSSLAG